MTQRWPVLILCALVLYLTHFFQLGNLPFVGADEPRYARIGEEMAQRGDYLTPTLNSLPWLEKPPLLFWLEAAVFRILGASEATARLPVALLSAFTVLMCAAFAYWTSGERRAFLSFLILATSPLFFVFARAASTDMPLTACFSAALLSAYVAARTRGNLWAAAAGAALGLAVLAKGPVAIILLAAVLGLYCVLLQRFVWTLGQVLAGAAAFSLVGVPWFWLMWTDHGYDFVATFLLNHHLARFLTSIHHHTQPFWYFIPVLLIGFFPWVFFLSSSLRRLWGLRQRLAEEELPLDLLLWIWVLAPTVFFSMSNSKLAGYVLPVFPALALLAASEWDRFFAGDLTSFRSMKGELSAAVAVGLVMSIALLVGGLMVYSSVSIGIGLAAPVFLGVLWGQFEFRRKRPVQVVLSLTAAMTLFAAMAAWWAAPVIGQFHSARDILRVAPAISADRPLVLFRYFHHTAQYYTGYRTTREAIPDMDALREYMSAHPQEKYLILTQKSGWQELESELSPRMLVQEGNLYLVEVSARAAEGTVG